MKNIFKRTLALCLALMMSFGFAGCNENQSAEQEEDLTKGLIHAPTADEEDGKEEKVVSNDKENDEQRMNENTNGNDESVDNASDVRHTGDYNAENDNDEQYIRPEDDHQQILQ